MPFNLRMMDDERKARMGVLECVGHRLIEPFQVLFEKEGKKLFKAILFIIFTVIYYTPLLKTSRVIERGSS